MSGTMTSPLTEGRQGPPTDSTIAIVAPGSTRRRLGGAVKRRRGPVPRAAAAAGPSLSLGNAPTQTRVRTRRWT